MNGVGECSAKAPHKMGQHFTIPKSIRDNPDVKRVTVRWDLTPRELDLMYSKFRTLDITNDGEIEVEEFFSFMPESQFQLFDTIKAIIVPPNKRDEPVTFPIWLCAVFSFCFMTRAELAKQVFSAYDSRLRGRLSINNVFDLLHAIHCDNAFFPRDVVLEVENIVLKGGGRLDFDTFTKACHNFPMLLWPVYRVQQGMRESVLGLKLFRKLDKHSGDIELSKPLGRSNKSHWRSRKNRILLYACGWPCCPQMKSKGTELHHLGQTPEEAALTLAKMDMSLENEKGFVKDKKGDKKKKTGAYGELKEGEKKEDGEAAPGEEGLLGVETDEQRVDRELEAARQLRALMETVADSEPSSDESFNDREEDEFLRANIW